MARGVFNGGTGRILDRRTKLGKKLNGGPRNLAGTVKFWGLSKPKSRKSR